MQTSDFSMTNKNIVASFPFAHLMYTYFFVCSDDFFMFCFVLGGFKAPTHHWHKHTGVFIYFV